MISRILEKKVDLTTNEETINLKQPIELEYYLLESESTDIEELSGKKVFGIEIIKRTGSGNLETESVRNFSCCRESTRSVLDKLARNTVTPLCLQFILDDMLGA